MNAATSARDNRHTFWRRLRVVAIPVSLTLVAACFAQPRTRMGGNNAATGHIELGEKSAAYWGVASMVAYPEVPKGAVPLAVHDSATAWVERARYDSRCVRYFRATSIYIVAAPAFCHDERGLRPEHVEIAAFEANGLPRKAGIADSWDERLRIVPEFRPRAPEPYSSSCTASDTA